MTSKQSKTIADYVDEFADCMQKQDSASDVEKGNKYARRKSEIFHFLVDNYGDAGREALTTLFRHADPSVRCIAAAWLLRYAHDDAMAVLDEIAQGKGFVAFRAQQAMERWRDGDWKLDPGP